jgi:hypothetical protein
VLIIPLLPSPEGTLSVTGVSLGWGVIVAARVAVSKGVSVSSYVGEGVTGVGVGEGVVVRATAVTVR